ncbi:MAG: class I SAM-dependent methyltransferase [Actinomycetota bacterium]|nr:class I SAM-dependent methyltransferase [Actinomycetota bacterium]
MARREGAWPARPRPLDRAVTLNDPEVVRRDYASESRLLDRRSIYETSEGPSTLDVLWDRIAEAAPERVLEVGPGPGELSERMATELGAEVVAIDVSERMVELCRARAVDARLGDVQALAFEDASFDLVVAAWVLFHPEDLDRALSEIARVLRPGGRLIAATNSELHLIELWQLLGIERTRYSFGAENGERSLRDHFASVTTHVVEGAVSFADTAVVRNYVASSILYGHLADRVPEVTEPLRARRKNAVFVAKKAA